MESGVSIKILDEGRRESLCCPRHSTFNGIPEEK